VANIDRRIISAIAALRAAPGIVGWFLIAEGAPVD
jgi:hypothetical protein